MELIEEKQSRSLSEVVAVVEALIFVSDEPLTTKLLAEVMEEDKESIEAAVEELTREYKNRESGLQLREIAGGWQISTRTEFHEADALAGFNRISRLHVAQNTARD